jgi:hypothetical protein
VAKQPIFAAYHEGLYRALCAIIIDVQVPIFCVGVEFFPLI